MANGTRLRGTTTVAAALLLLSLLGASALPSASSSVFAEMLTRKGLLDSADKPRTIAVDLINVQHVDSPLLQPNLTLTERVQISVANSERRTKRRTLASTYVFTTPLESIQEEYIMRITLGTPARTFVAIADTGSDLVWLQCSGSTCNDTNCIISPDQPFNPSASSSYSSVPCDATACQDLRSTEHDCPSTGICAYNFTYLDQTSIVGSLGYETFTLTEIDGSTTGVPYVAFGCGTDDESPTFPKDKFDGFVGLGRGNLSLPSQLAAGSVISPVFSYCLVDFYSATTVTSPLLLGSAGPAAKIYTPLVLNPFSSHYFVNLVGITVNGEAISYPAGTFDIDSCTGLGGIILDSGTTITQLFEAAYTPFKSNISALITYPLTDEGDSGLSPCYDISSVSNPVFPTVGFQFENDVDLTLGFNNTFLAINSARTVYCLAFLSTSPNATSSIFGNVQQSNFEISYDVGNQQVGFAAGAC